jgi:hypothetical protein
MVQQNHDGLKFDTVYALRRSRELSTIPKCRLEQRRKRTATGAMSEDLFRHTRNFLSLDSRCDDYQFLDLDVLQTLEDSPR